MTLRRTKRNARMSGAVRWSWLAAIVVLLCLVDTPRSVAWPNRAYMLSRGYSEAFLLEDEAAYISFQFDERGFWRTDFNGRWHTSTDGHRATLHQPQAGPALYIFGSSVVYGLFLPDGDTLPGALQRLTHHYRVVNMGAIPATLRQQFARLQTLDLHSGDVVLLYDDISDIAAVRDGVLSLEAWRINYVMLTAQFREYAQKRGARTYTLRPPAILPGEPCPAPLACEALYLKAVQDASSLVHVDITPDRPPLDMFLDVVHLTREGNAIVAREIYAALFGTF